VADELIIEAVEDLVIETDPPQTLVIHTQPEGAAVIEQPLESIEVVNADVLIVSATPPPESVTSEGVQAPAGIDLSLGMPVYLNSQGTLQPAAADTLPRAASVGLIVQPGNAGETVAYASDGSLERTDWSAITGAGLLTPGQIYYLSHTPGQLTPVVPTAGFALAMGRAVSSTRLDIELSEPIKLSE